MIRYEDECCDCAVPSYPCLGSSCPNRHVKHLYCDDCGEDAEELYKHDGMELCKDCLLGYFEKIT